MDIQQYIATQRQNGLNDQQILQLLVAAGWQPDQAQAALYGQLQPFAYAQSAPKTRHWPLIIMVLFVLVASGVAIFIQATSDKTANQQNQNTQANNTDSTDQNQETPDDSEQPSDADTLENNRRKSQVEYIVAQLTAYAANNSGKLPESNESGWQAFTAAMDNKEALLVNDTGLELAYTSLAPQEGEVQYVRSAECADQTVIGAGSARLFAVMIRLVDGTFYCQDNSDATDTPTSENDETNTTDETGGNQSSAPAQTNGSGEGTEE